MVQDRYGGPEVLELRDVDEPEPSEGQVLVRVRASALNPLDWHFMRGEPLVMRAVSGLRHPKRRTLGSDVAGVVERLGPGVTGLAVGDEVWGWVPGGGLAELVRVRATHLLPKPAELSFEEAGGIGVAAFTALQAVRDHGEVGEGSRVLVIGASGGVGTFAVQIAKALGAHVTGVCSTRNVELVRSLGADEVVDYTVDDPTRRRGAYDVVLQVNGAHPLRQAVRPLVRGGVLVSISGEGGGRLLGPLGRLVTAQLWRPWLGRRFRSFTAVETPEDGLVLQGLVESGAVRPVVDRTYPLAAAAEAMAYLETTRARGKVVVIP